jgi:hypothetical protein
MMHKKKSQAAGPGNSNNTLASKSHYNDSPTPSIPVLDRFENVRKLGIDRWIACCPAHDDKTPSLSIQYAGDKWLFHCHAGCATEDVISAVGLAWKDICPSNPAYAAATMQKRKLPPVDELDIDKTVIQMANNAIERGNSLSLEDQARVRLAIERVSNG